MAEEPTGVSEAFEAVRQVERQQRDEETTKEIEQVDRISEAIRTRHGGAQEA